MKHALVSRRSFVGGAAALAATAGLPASTAMPRGKSLKFLFVTDHHIESDFVQSFGVTAGEPSYACWKPGNHAAVEATYAFINTDAFCRDCDFALFGGDQLNTGYASHPVDMAAEKANYFRTLEKLDLYAKTKGRTADFDFAATPFVVGGNLGRGMKPYRVLPREPQSRVIAIQGNHDTAVEEFYRDCAFTAGGVRFIAFFASYVGLPPTPNERFNSTANIADETIAFIEREMARAKANPAIRHIVLVSHWAIAPRSKDFGYGIVSSFPGVKLNGNRDRLLTLAEKYGCRLYINGHEHNSNYPVAAAGVMTDINCGTLTAPKDKGAFAIVEMDDHRAVFHVYTRAIAEEIDGRAVITACPRALFSREIPLA